MARPSACGHAITSTVTVRVDGRRRRRRAAPRPTNVTTAGAGGDVEEQRRRAVGERLRARPRRLRLGHEPLDAGERVSSPTALDAHADRRVGRDRPGDDPVAARASRDRPRLAGDHRLVELGRAVDDLAVGRDAAARPHQHDVAAPRARPARRSRPCRRRRPARPRRAAARRARPARPAPGRSPHLLPVAEQHDHDERGELPPEVEVEAARARSPALATNATVIAIAISSIIPGWRSRSSPTAPVRNGQPP